MNGNQKLAAIIAIAWAAVMIALIFASPGEGAPAANTIYRAADTHFPILKGASENLRVCIQTGPPTRARGCPQAALNLRNKAAAARAAMVGARLDRNPACGRRFRQNWLMIPDSLKLAAVNFRNQTIYQSYMQQAGVGYRNSIRIREACNAG